MTKIDGFTPQAILVCLFVIFWNHNGGAAAQPLLRFHHQSFPQPYISGVSRDAKGFAWISTKENLYRFDGKELAPFGMGVGLKSRDIQSKVFFDEHGNGWFCTNEALYKMTMPSHTCQRIQVRFNDGKTVENGYHVFELDTVSGYILLVAGRHLFCLNYKDTYTTPDNSTPRHYLLKPTDKDYFAAVQWPDGSTVYCGFGASASPDFFNLVVQNNTATCKPVSLAGQWPTEQVNHIMQTPDGLIWAAMKQHLIAYNPLTGKTDAFGAPSALNHLAYWPEKQSIWAASASTGLLLFDLKTRNWSANYQYNPEDNYSIAENNIQSVYLDHESTLWISIWTRGLDFTNLKKAKFSQQQINRYSYFIPEQIHEDPHHQLWISSRKNGLLRFDPATGQVTNLSKLAPHAIHTLSPDASTTMVTAFGDMVAYRHDGATFSPVRYSSTGRPVSGAYMLQSGQDIYVSNLFEPGIVLLQKQPGNRWSATDLKNPDISNTVWSMLYRDNAGHLYADGSGRGLVVFKNDFSDKPVLEIGYAGEAKSFTENADYVWVGGDFGLLQINKTSRSYSFPGQEQGFPNVGICALAYDTLYGQAGIWVSHGNGLFWYSPATQACIHFDHFDGIQSRNYSGGSFLRTSNQQIFFGGTQGLTAFMSGHLRPLPIPAVPYLGAIVVNGAPAPALSPGNQLILPYHQNNISVQVGIIDFCNHDNCLLTYQVVEQQPHALAILFQYLKEKIWGADEQPVSPTLTKPGPITFEKLAPGIYHLNIKAINSDGITNPETLEVAIHIEPPFWQTWWFLLLLCGIIALLVYAFHKYRIGQIRAQEARKREIERQKAELAIKATRAQMNTHFIKNILTSIDTYILQANPAKASSYLIKCSQLMDTVLSYSIHPFITMQKELDFINRYIELGTMNWKHELQYELIYDSDKIAIENIKIPTLLLQPFVENALLHGLQHWPGTRRLSIEIIQDTPSVILCRIMNNGHISLPEDGQLKDARPHAIQIAKERLRLYDLQYDTKSRIELQQNKDSIYVNIYLGQ